MKTRETISCTVTLADNPKFSGDLYLPPNKLYTLVIDYPLSNPYHKSVCTGGRGIKTNQLIGIIVKAYRHIYDVEDRQDKKGMEETTYGVWGHDIDDLVLCRISVNHKKRTITLGVDS